MKRKYIFVVLLTLCLSFGAAVTAQAAAPAAESRLVLLDKGKGKNKDSGGQGIGQKEKDFSGLAKTVAVCLIVGGVAGGAVGVARHKRSRPAPSEPRRPSSPAQRSAYYRPARKGERYGQVPAYMTETAEAPDLSGETQILRAPGHPAEDDGQTQILRRPPEEWQPLSAWDRPGEDMAWTPTEPVVEPADPAPGPAPVHPSMADSSFAAFDDLLRENQTRPDDAFWMTEPEEPILEDEEPGDVNFII